MGDYAPVRRGKHLFGGVYETLVDGEVIGATKQGRWNPWWLPANGGMGTTDYTNYAFGVVIGIFGAMAALTVYSRMIAPQRNPSRVSLKEARRIGEELGVDWSTSPFGVAQFRTGIEVEREHGPGGPAGVKGDVTHGHMVPTAQIALAHLTETPDYYIRLAVMEAEAECK
jgi:hypothetical protein